MSIRCDFDASFFSAISVFIALHEFGQSLSAAQPYHKLVGGSQSWRPVFCPFVLASLGGAVAAVAPPQGV